MSDKRPPIKVTRDDDGGLTLHDPLSGIVLSVIATHPAANGPKGLYVEAYSYQPGDVMWEDVTRREIGDDSPRVFAIARHPTIAFYAERDKS